MQLYDALIIGTGQAGPSLAAKLAAAGRKVAIVERNLFGGTCVNTGCIPTKTLVASAYAAHLARGIHYFKSGVQTRGSQNYDHTTTEQLHGMQLYLEKARQDLQDSLALDPKPMASYGVLMRTNMQLGDQAAVRTLLDAALKLDAHALSPRRAYMRSIQTRFGGSLQQMIDFVQSSGAAGLTPGQLAVLQQFVDDERKWLEARSGLPDEGAVASN